MNYKVFPWGKYKGYDFSDIPSTYITYALDEFDMPEDLANQLRLQLIMRYDLAASGDYSIPTDLKDIYRQLSKKYHPDAGGTTQAMQAVNEFYELLKALA